MGGIGRSGAGEERVQDGVGVEELPRGHAGAKGAEGAEGAEGGRGFAVCGVANTSCFGGIFFEKAKSGQMTATSSASSFCIIFFGQLALSS